MSPRPAYAQRCAAPEITAVRGRVSATSVIPLTAAGVGAMRCRNSAARLISG